MSHDKNTIIADILRDLDQMKGLGGKEWSVTLAKELGLSAEEIELYMSKQEPHA